MKIKFITAEKLFFDKLAESENIPNAYSRYTNRLIRYYYMNRLKALVSLLPPKVLLDNVRILDLGAGFIPLFLTFKNLVKEYIAVDFPKVYLGRMEGYKTREEFIHNYYNSKK